MLSRFADADLFSAPLALPYHIRYGAYSRLTVNGII